jgi:hypothetical protein
MEGSAGFSRHYGQPALTGILSRGLQSELISLCAKFTFPFRLIILFGIVIFFPRTTAAEIVLQIGSGTSHSLDTTLKIEQSGKPAVRFSASYETHPWKPAPYYAIRIGKWKEKSGWELELIHHKLYLNNPQPPVDSFRITNGYSLLLANYAREYEGFIFRVGGGALITYPIASIERIVTSGGYSVSGVAAQVAAEKRLFLRKNVFLSAEGKLTLAHAKLTLKNAKATVPNVALHGLVSIGYEF